MGGDDIDEAFITALFGEDELGLVVRAHIHIEAGINALLEIAVPHPSLLPRLRYEQRVRLACALGLDERWLQPLIRLGDLRNQFGHKLDTTLTDGTVGDICCALSEADVAGFMLGVTAALPEVKSMHDFRKLSPRQQFILLAVGLDKMLAQARDEWV